jgi:hypothetical protein
VIVSANEQIEKKKFRLVKRGLRLLAEALTKVFDELERPVLSQFALHTNRVHLNRFFQIYSAAANHFALSLQSLFSNVALWGPL